MGAFFPPPDAWWKQGPINYQGRSLAQWVQSLFGGGVPGVLFVPSPDTCFQDAAGTTPAGVSDPVGLMLDLSGNGNNATQETDAARPTLEQDDDGLYYLDLDGTQFMLHPVVLTTFSYGISIGVRFTSTGAVGVVCGHRQAQPGPVRSTLAQIYRESNDGSRQRNAADADPGYTTISGAALDQDTPYAVGGRSAAGGSFTLRLNGAQSGSAATTPTGAITVDRAALGTSAHALENPMVGRIYGAFEIAATPSLQQMTLVDRYIGGLAGAAI